MMLNWRRIAGAAAVCALGLAPHAGAQEAPPDGKPKYIGAETCAKLCHKTAKQGEQLRIWQESKHSQAFAALASEEAKKIGKAKGIADPQKADACLKCHQTGHGSAADLFEATYVATEGVGCEACHGPGSLYKQRSVMKDKAKAISLGLVVPDEKTCKKCHNEESPTYKPFKYDERVKLIAHAVPKEG